MGAPTSPAKNMGPLNGHEDPTPSDPVRTIQFLMPVPAQVGDRQGTEPFQLTLPSFGSSATDPLNRSIFPSYHLRTQLFPSAGGGTALMRGAIGAMGWRDMESSWRFRYMDMTSLMLDGIRQVPLEVTAKVWINRKGGVRPDQSASPPFIQLTDPKLTPDPDTRRKIVDSLLAQDAKSLQAQVDQLDEKDPPAKPAESRLKEVWLQLIVGPQNVQHTNPIPAPVPNLGNAYEDQGVVGVALNLQFHHDDDPGWEIGPQVQVTADIAAGDPSATAPPLVGAKPTVTTVPKPWAVQAVLPLSYVIPLSKLAQLTIQGQALVGYTIHTRHPFAYGYALSGELDYKIYDNAKSENDDSSVQMNIFTALQEGETYQDSKQTADVTIAAGLKIQWKIGK